MKQAIERLIFEHYIHKTECKIMGLTNTIELHKRGGKHLFK